MLFLDCVEEHPAALLQIYPQFLHLFGLSKAAERQRLSFDFVVHPPMECLREHEKHAPVARSSTALLEPTQGVRHCHCEAWS